MTKRGPKDDTQLVDYVTKNLWGSPEENKQYQINIKRVTDIFGVNRTFNLMNKWRNVPIKDKFYHIFTVGGLDQGFWNFNNRRVNRNPFDRWVNLGELCVDRGIHVDVYNVRGFQYSRKNIWVMSTYDGLTLIAIEKIRQTPVLPNLEMYVRCYTPSIAVDFGQVAQTNNGNPYAFETLNYSNGSELNALEATYQFYSNRPGYTGVLHNGVFVNTNPLNIPNLKVGDLIEIWHDPTVIRTEIYEFDSLVDYYSELDKKRKVILHPPKDRGEFRLRYFDDNDYYLIGTNNRGLYFHRNSVSTIRQLTQVDVAIADDQVRKYCDYLPELSQPTNIKILVLVRDTDWDLNWVNEHQRLRYLYRMPDQDIVKAFTGDRANMSEWTANELESGPVLSLLRGRFDEITRENTLEAIGYNAATRVLSENVIRGEYELGSRGVEIPFSYRTSCTVWEYNELGKLLGYYNLTNSRYHSPINVDCKKIEFTIGHFGLEIDHVITNQNLTIDPMFDYRVYKSPFNVITNQITYELTDITDDETQYKIVGNQLVWTNLDKVNQRGVVVSNKKSLGVTFELDHLDKSLSFNPNKLLTGVNSKLPIAFGNLDVWLNGSPLIDGVDWIFKDGICYIVNKEFIVSGPQVVTVRGHGFTEDLLNPRFDNELGFIDGGVIGRFDRYNLRADRTTRTIINGCLQLTDEVIRAEREVPDEQWNPLNGKPYSVKHVLTPIVGVVDFKNYPGFERSRELDKRVSNYLTEYLPKPRNNSEEITWENRGYHRPEGSGIPVTTNIQDKYRLFSPTLNAIVNAIKSGIVNVPELLDEEDTFSDQEISELVRPFLWWLEHDPVTLKFDRRYFAIMPYSNFEKLTVTSDEFVFIKQVNDLYLEGVCSITGHFTVNDNII